MATDMLLAQFRSRTTNLFNPMHISGGTNYLDALVFVAVGFFD